MVLDDVFQAAGMTSHVYMGDLATALASWLRACRLLQLPCGGTLPLTMHLQKALYRERPLRGLRLGGRKAGAGWLEHGRRWGHLDLHGLQPEEAGDPLSAGGWSVRVQICARHAWQSAVLCWTPRW